jgi:hypothetical protein
MMANFSVLFKIRHNSKENISAISVSEKFKINEHLVKMIQYHGWLLDQWPGQLSRRFKNMDSLRKIALGPWILLDSVRDSVG